MPTGTVKFYDPGRGYGFVQTDGERGAEMFLHARALQRSGIPEVNAGDRIAFDILVNDRPGHPHRGKAEVQNIRLLAAAER
jgi:CspA family cold shock protein